MNHLPPSSGQSKLFGRQQPMIKGNEEKRKVGDALEAEVAVPLKHWYLSTKLRGIKSQKMVILIAPTMLMLYFTLVIFLTLLHFTIESVFLIVGE
jgi:hypothetical protein